MTRPNQAGELLARLRARKAPPHSTLPDSWRDPLCAEAANMIETLLRASPAGEAVAWRWRFEADGSWSYGSNPPGKFRFGDPKEVQPLFALPAQGEGCGWTDHVLREALRKWSCGSCGGSGEYLNRSVARGAETVTCKVCEGHGLNPIARTALSAPSQVGTEAEGMRELGAHLHSIRSVEGSCPKCADTRRSCANTIAEMEVEYRAALQSGTGK